MKNSDTGGEPITVDISRVQYTDPALVRGTRVDAPEDYPANPYLHFYGSKIPTRYRIQYGTLHWRRVYVHQWGNAGSAYIVVSGKPMYLDPDTETRLQTGAAK